MHKKIFCIALVVILLTSLSACANKSLENIQNAGSDGILVFLQYSHDAKPSTPSIDVPDNYAEMGDGIYAVLNDSNEIIGYKKLILDDVTGEYIFKDCDANGKVTGTTPENPVTVINSLTLDKTSVELTEGTTSTIIYVIDPTDFVPNNIKWSSSDEQVATVSDGTVTANKSGECVITLTIEDKTATCSVKVNPKPTEPEEIKPNSISLSKSSASVYIGNSITLNATVSPNEAKNKTVTWTSSDSNVATVYNGTVTGKSSGTVTITATTVNGKTATCKVTVSKKPEEQPKPIVTNGITLNKNSVDIYIGETATITATVSPSNAADKSVTWTSSNNSIATVSNGKITAIAEGSATITAKASGGQTSTCTVNVKKKVQAFTYSIISQSDCPLSISNEFDNYLLTGSAKNLAVSKDGYTYVMIKVAGSGKISVTSVTENNGQITITTKNTGTSNCVFVKFNRETQNIVFK